MLKKTTFHTVANENVFMEFHCQIKKMHYFITIELLDCTIKIGIINATSPRVFYVGVNNVVMHFSHGRNMHTAITVQ